MAQQQITSLAQFQNWVSSIVDTLGLKTVILLEGDLGVGKTQFCQFLAKEFSYEEVSSPTYSLIHEYSGKKQLIYHLDLYRLEGLEELESIAFWDLFEETSAIICIEWSNKLDIISYLPIGWDVYQLKIEKTSLGAEEERLLYWQSL